MSVQPPGTPPPFVDPMPVGLDNLVIPQAVQEEFVRGILEGMRAEMDMVAQTTGTIEQDWRAIQSMNRQILNETRQAAEEISQIRLNEDQQAQALRAMQDMGIRPELIQQVMESLAAQGQQRARRDTEARSTAADTAEGRGDRPEGQEAPRRPRRAGEDSEQTEPSPYLDARRAGRVPDEMLDAQGMPEGRSRDALPMTWSQGVAMGSNWGNLRQATANKVNEWWSGTGIAGNLERPTMDPEGFYTDAEGNRTRRAHMQGQEYERQMGRRERVANVISRVGAGEGLSGAASALGGGVARVAGVAGAVYGGVQLADTMYRAQRDANLEYIGTFGGGTGEALEHRLAEFGFSHFGSLGKMDSDQARQLFQGVSRLGFEGGERQRALDFATENLSRYGMDIATSMRFITIANEDGIEALQSYRASLEALAEVAEESGASIRQAHEAYVQAIEQTRQITSGTAASELAEALSGVDINLQDTPLEGVDFTGLMADRRARSEAAMSMGLTYEEFSARMTQGDQEVISSLIDSSIGSEGMLMQEVRAHRLTPEQEQQIEQIRSRAPGGVLGTEHFTQIAAVLRGAGAWSEWHEEAAARNFGVRMTPAQWDQWIARNYVNDPSVDIGQAVDQVAEISDTSERTTMPDGSPIRRTGLDLLLHGPDSAEKLREAWGWVDTDRGFMGIGDRLFNNLIEGERVHRSGDRYIEMLQGGVLPERMMGLESFYEQVGSDQASADKYESAKFQVIRDDGSTRIIGMQDLPTYAREIELGQVSVIQGDRRIPLQDITGYNVAEARERVEAREAEKRQQEVRVTVEPVGSLAEFLRFQQTGGAEAERSRSEGTPMSPFSGILSRFTGTGGD